ncbi:MAG: cobyric acid synthase [Planctomycetes bacterium]|nr:cobyric acid synthase [Planctomycetota bacterium]
MLDSHGGNITDLSKTTGIPQSEILDLSASINPIGPPEWLRKTISRSISDICHYPDINCTELVDTASEKYGVGRECIVAGNGSSEILFAIPNAFKLKSAIIPVPAYSDYERVCHSHDIRVNHHYLREEDEFRIDLKRLGNDITEPSFVFIGHPNNPTGALVDSVQLIELAREKSDSIFVIDEAYQDFCSAGSSFINSFTENMIILKSLTKSFCIPGLRAGLAFSSPAIVEKISAFIPPWSVNTFAQKVSAKAICDKEYKDLTLSEMSRLRTRMINILGATGKFEVIKSDCNFLLVKIIDESINSSELKAMLLSEYGIAIRDCKTINGLTDRFVRIAVCDNDGLDRLEKAFDYIFKMSLATVSVKRKKAIMFQGTSSNAGKSLVTAAFCRILFQDGYSVAPFKAQNMALNSFVTKDGCEMGRAQVLQAHAANIDPDVRMNPVLMKPSSETGSQVIVNGKPVGNFKVREFYAYKETAFATIKNSFDSLSSEHDIIVLEGAGSPGEVNLKKNDIVNMRMARYANADVFLVGDIDRGGVYSSFIGTMDVMEEWERRLVKGFIVNKFRGDASLLRPAHDYVLDFTGKPVLGVIPFMRDHGLPEEDSVSFKEDFVGRNTRKNAAEIDIALIDLPYCSNFTDIDPLYLEPDVDVRLVRRADELGRPDAVIIPGSKRVAPDIAFLKETGLFDAIKSLPTDTTVMGVCAGMQILGREVNDPHHLESNTISTEALGLLPIITEFAIEKTLCQSSAVHAPSGLNVTGYEIHHGVSSAVDEVETIIVSESGSPIGYASPTGNVWGTYLHGIFDNDEFRRWVIDGLRVKKKIAPLGKVVANYEIDSLINKLADKVRASVDLKEIYRICGL